MPEVGWVEDLLGPATAPVDPEILVEDQVDCGGYVRERVTYAVAPGERVAAYRCVPHGLSGPTAGVVVHHQHAQRFDLGKSEPVGLAGDPDQAVAHELAERGLVTIAYDAIGFEERNPTDDGAGNACWQELATRLVVGRTLLRDVLRDVAVAADVLAARPEVDGSRLGFFGHSYGGRVALWVPAVVPRLRAVVSSCGCISYADSLTEGLQAETVVPGIHRDGGDLADVVSTAGPDAALLVLAAEDDRWSRGARELVDRVRPVLGDRVELAAYPGGHALTATMRQHACQFLETRLRPVPRSGS